MLWRRHGHSLNKGFWRTHEWITEASAFRCLHSWEETWEHSSSVWGGLCRRKDLVLGYCEVSVMYVKFQSDSLIFSKALECLLCARLWAGPAEMQRWVRYSLCPYGDRNRKGHFSFVRSIMVSVQLQGILWDLRRARLVISNRCFSFPLNYHFGLRSSSGLGVEWVLRGYWLNCTDHFIMRGRGLWPSDSFAQPRNAFLLRSLILRPKRFEHCQSW